MAITTVANAGLIKAEKNAAAFNALIWCKTIPIETMDPIATTAKRIVAKPIAPLPGTRMKAVNKKRARRGAM